jgi:hypothetical protein
MAALVMELMEPERSRMNAISVFMFLFGRMSKGLKVGRSNGRGKTEDFETEDRRQEKEVCMIPVFCLLSGSEAVFCLPVAAFRLHALTLRVNKIRRRRQK